MPRINPDDSQSMMRSALGNTDRRLRRENIKLDGIARELGPQDRGVIDAQIAANRQKRRSIRGLWGSMQDFVDTMITFS